MEKYYAVLAPVDKRSICFKDCVSLLATHHPFGGNIQTVAESCL